jgi:putative SOS response-associated peptidase YedK
MCGRHTLRTPAKSLATLLDLADEPVLVERYNIAPAPDVAVVRAGSGATRSLDMLGWGLVPSWAQHPGKGDGLSNARAETADRLPAFRHTFRQRRCLLPPTGSSNGRAKAAGASRTTSTFRATAP